MLHFTRLRLTGFKSFVEPTELLIAPGLTGIVGPNGCGKSNVVEALRWVMGELSARQMRGGEMDDVIFGGTQDRPARNLAEVQIFLDNRGRDAAAQFNDSDEIEVVRRIERGEGSAYRINGRDTRARDVQLLFADAATGARSTALVSQGRISAIINAKPTDRRALLEEAAGITGLHSRRHEAELRLRAAEANLERLDDVLQTMEAQLQALKKQARQASRYRNLSDHIRRAEAVLLHLRWNGALSEVDRAGTLYRQIEQLVADLTGRVAACSTEQAEASLALPPLRQGEAEAAAELHRYAVARDALDTEERRVVEAQRAIEIRLAQLAADVAREEGLLADAAAAIQRLGREQSELTDAHAREADAIAAARAAFDEANANVALTEDSLNSIVQELAAGEARQSALDKGIADFDGRNERLRQRRQEIDDERARIEAEAGVSAALEEAKRAVVDAVAHAESTREAAQAAEDARAAAQAEENSGREALQAPDAARSQLAAEESALARLLASETSGMWPPLVDAVTVEHGLEAALGAALGDDLSAPIDEGAPVHWRALPPFAESTPLPHGCEPLSSFVRGPAVLARRLAQIGVVPDTETGRVLSARLAQGQRLVTKAGDLWRWDGYTVAAGAPTAAANRLSQRNRLEDVRQALVGANAAVETARTHLIEMQARAREAVEAERARREQAREAFAALNAARDAEQKLAHKVAAHSSRLSALRETALQLETDMAETARQASDARDARATLPDLALVRERLDQSRASLAEKRNLQRERQGTFDRLIGEARTRRERIESCAQEYGSWETRAAAAGRQITELEERKNAAEAESRELAAKPAEIAAQRAILLDLIATAEARRREAADRLAEAENRLAEADKALKSADAELHIAREDRVRREAAVAAAEQAKTAIAERIAERLNCGPEETLEVAELKPGQELPSLDQIEARLNRLIAERENMGPVNLRAEQESREVEEQIVTLQTERADLVGAIARLRQAIAELNREGRERLLASFDEVNRHFTELFVRLFGGGRAFLQLIESEDPLESGLEIMASPPGKKLQMLSLLSGGEQALTALSLLFAVFMTNPAPICVLDEVDAPLDDANVDRFCVLLEEIAHHSQTRFLLITHHRMTMARMDRLFGITMPERGVSQLVSVDLQEAESIRATA